MGRLDDKVCIVTGAGRGIGRGIARRFAMEGASVVVAEIIEAEGAQVAAEIESAGGKATFVRTDVSSKDDVYAMARVAEEAYGGVDVLVNCAIALSPHLPLNEKTKKMHDFVLRVGLYGTLWGMQAVFPMMRERGGGRIINFDSYAKFNGQIHTVDYNATKGAITALTVSAAAEWAQHGILCNTISPASASMGFHKMVEETPQILDALAATPLGHVADPEEEVAPAAVFLASEDGGFVTGQTITVDGGFFTLATVPMFGVDSEERVQAWLQKPFNVQE